LSRRMKIIIAIAPRTGMYVITDRMGQLRPMSE
jgi:hypothetical protein